MTSRRLFALTALALMALLLAACGGEEPDLDATADVLVNERLTATADEWTATPTATNTATATQPFTATPLPSATPDWDATVEADVVAQVAAYLTATAEEWTATPTATNTPTATQPPTQTPEPSATPDWDATVAADVSEQVVIELTQHAQEWTATPEPSATPDWDATLNAQVALALTATVESQPTATIQPTATLIPLADAADDDAFKGPADAPVVIVEFSDFQCGFCGRWYSQTLPLILENYPDEVKFVYRDFVIFGEDSMRGAMATECAEEQGKFWEMHDAIFESRMVAQPQPLREELLVSLAEGMELDVDAFTTCLRDGRYQEEVIADYQAAVSYGLQGTPGFVINGVVYPIGAQPFEVFDEIIQQILADGPSAALAQPANPEPTEPPQPSADNWVEVEPGRFAYTGDSRLTTVIAVDRTTQAEFVERVGLNPPGEDSPLVDLMSQIHADLTVSIAEANLTSQNNMITQPATETVSDVTWVWARFRVAPQTAAEGQLYPGSDFVLGLSRVGEDELVVVQFTIDNGVSDRAYDDFRAWLEIFLPIVTAPGQ